ncbi:hypothetical protein HSX11_14890 [Oxalobacteraceae bacterium]|nr:hypothetical protein [Oxalobacteraceae bacterium]
MDPIIRTPALASEPRQLRRVTPVRPAAPLTAPASAPQTPGQTAAQVAQARAQAPVPAQPQMPAGAAKAQPAAMPAVGATQSTPAQPPASAVLAATASAAGLPPPAPQFAPLPASGLLAQPPAQETPEQAQLAAEKKQAHDAALQALASQREQLRLAQQKVNDEAAQTLAAAEQRGFQQGQEKGEAEARAQLAAQLERLGAIGQQLTQARRKVLDEAEDTLVDIAYTALCRIVGQTMASRDGLVGMVNHLLSEAREAPAFTARLHPQDAELLLSDDTDAAQLDPRLSVRADSAVKLGGCLLDSPQGTLDARLDWQLQQLAAALIQARAARPARDSQDVGI